MWCRKHSALAKCKVWTSVNTFFESLMTSMCTKPAFSRNRIIEIAFRNHFYLFFRAHLRFLHITIPRKQLEGCWLEKKGPFPTRHTGRSTERINNMTHPFKYTVVHLQVWLLLPYFGDTSAHTHKQLKGVPGATVGHPAETPWAGN